MGSLEKIAHSALKGIYQAINNLNGHHLALLSAFKALLQRACATHLRYNCIFLMVGFCSAKLLLLLLSPLLCVKPIIIFSLYNNMTRLWRNKLNMLMNTIHTQGQGICSQSCLWVMAQISSGEGLEGMNKKE